MLCQPLKAFSTFENLALPLRELSAKLIERVNMQTPKNKELMENARRLRREMTPQERNLWYLFLQKYPVKIYKQRIIGLYCRFLLCVGKIDYRD